MRAKRLHLLLAPKERFEPDGAGAFALNALETSRVSRWRTGITVFGSPVSHPFSEIAFEPIALPPWSLRGRNVEMARRYGKIARRHPPDLVEVFNRPVMVDPIKHALESVPLALHLGNDPRGMDGSRSATERLALLDRAAAIVCVSDFIRRCFLDGIDSPRGALVHVLHTGVAAPPEFPPAKAPTIIFVGRIVPDKGVLELVEALALVLPRYPDWSAEILGAHWFGSSGRLSPYEKQVAQTAVRCERICLGGFQPHEQVIATLRRASIAVVPSQWDDPFPRTALEALANGCALVCSDRGGLPEIGDDRAVFLKSVSAETLAAALDGLISDDSRRIAQQHRGWEDFPFEIGRTTRRLDQLRAALMEIA